MNSNGVIAGSYLDAAGVYQPYLRASTGQYVPLPSGEPGLEYFLIHGLNDAGVLVVRLKFKGGVPMTRVGSLLEGIKPFKKPDSVSTEGWNVNQDGSVVGHYDTEDGRRLGFIAFPNTPSAASYVYESIDVRGSTFWS